LFGIFAEYEVVNTGGGRGLTIGFMLQIRGELEVLGFVSISILLMLEATYNQGTLIGRGTLQVRVKICWCFTLKFSAGVEYQFAGKTQQAFNSSPGHNGALLIADTLLEGARVTR